MSNQIPLTEAEKGMCLKARIKNVDAAVKTEDVFRKWKNKPRMIALEKEGYKLESVKQRECGKSAGTFDASIRSPDGKPLRSIPDAERDLAFRKKTAEEKREFRDDQKDVILDLLSHYGIEMTPHAAQQLKLYVQFGYDKPPIVNLMQKDINREFKRRKLY